MTKKLEEITPDEFWHMYIAANPPPPTITAEELGFARSLYMAGFGAMVQVALRVNSEPQERRDAVLGRLNSEIWGIARQLQGPDLKAN